MIKAFQQASLKTINYVVAHRHSDDSPSIVLNSTKAKADLGWQAKRGLSDIASSSWKWQMQNPFGYGVARRERVLCTGGLGYIGSHTVVKLVEHGFQVVIADSLTRSSTAVLERVRELTGEDIPCFDVNMNN